MTDVRDAFMRDVSVAASLEEGFEALVVVIRLPNKAIEVVTNTKNITEKIMEYVEDYTEEFVWKKNKDYKVVGYLLV